MVDNSELDDIPGTTVFTAARSRAGFHLNQFCMSLMKVRRTASGSTPTSGPTSTSGP